VPRLYIEYREEMVKYFCTGYANLQVPSRPDATKVVVVKGSGAIVTTASARTVPLAGLIEVPGTG
jgi:hypothetical protein